LKKFDLLKIEEACVHVSSYEENFSVYDVRTENHIDALKRMI